MALGITEEHEELRLAVRRFAETHITPAVVRAALDAETVERPRTHARKSGRDATGEQLVLRGGMHDGVARAGADDREVIDASCDVRYAMATN